MDLTETASEENPYKSGARSHPVVVFCNSAEELSVSAAIVRFTVLRASVMTSVHTSLLVARRILTGKNATKPVGFPLV
jgi:hypothetical protein